MSRADRMLAVLADGLPHSRADIFRQAESFFLTNNAASELRARGLVIEQWRDGAEFFYRLDSLGEPSREGGWPQPPPPPDVSASTGVSLGSPSEVDAGVREDAHATVPEPSSPPRKAASLGLSGEPMVPGEIPGQAAASRHETGSPVQLSLEVAA